MYRLRRRNSTGREIGGGKALELTALGEGWVGVAGADCMRQAGLGEGAEANCMRRGLDCGAGA